VKNVYIYVYVYNKKDLLDIFRDDHDVDFDGKIMCLLFLIFRHVGNSDSAGFSTTLRVTYVYLLNL